MAQGSLRSWLLDTVQLPDEAFESLKHKLLDMHVCEVGHLKLVRKAGKLGALFSDRPAAEMQAVLAALRASVGGPGPFQGGKKAGLPGWLAGGAAVLGHFSAEKGLA